MEGFHINTPLLYSTPISDFIGCKVYVKLDSVQPSGSFKIRGISHHCIKQVKEHNKNELITSSGGNAGLAVAYSGKKLGTKVTVVVPESTPPSMRSKIQAEGAEVIVHGKVWDDANEFALKLATNPNSAYIHPFDHPDLWEGHSTLITEIKESLGGQKPTAVVTVVGGGGLLVGILYGLHKVGWQDVPVIACETDGADSFSQAVKQGKIVTLPGITSIAKTLGAKTVCKEAFEWTKKHKIHSVVVTDKMAVEACLKFADDHRVLVEPSCGAGMACIYSKIPEVQNIVKEHGKDALIVAIGCGGNMVSLNTLLEWKKQFGIE